MAKKVPEYSFSGASSSELKNGYWYIYLKSSGELRMTYAKRNVELCVVGGGAAGSFAPAGRGGSGGGGGAVNNRSGITIEAGFGYGITIGAGGRTGDSSNSFVANPGGASSAFGVTSTGGAVGGGGAGSNDADAVQAPSGTYAFGDTSLKRYGAAGGGGGDAGHTGGAGGYDGGGDGADGGSWGGPGKSATAGAANSGGGGGGGGWREQTDGGDMPGGAAASGGSGVVILRGTDDDLIPVFFNGTQLSKIIFNGVTLTGLIKDGTRIFARRARRRVTMA